MKKILLMALLFILPVTAQAQQDAFIFQKTVIKIIPKAGQTEPLPATDEKDKKEEKQEVIDPESIMPVLKRAPKEFTVEVRQPSFLEQSDFISHQPFTDKEGMLILIDPPADAKVKATRMLSSSDILFVDQDGYIIKIAPNLKLSELSEPIDSGKPIHAFIYLNAGMTAQSDIQVGDRIEHPYFKTHPVVIQ